MQVQITQLFGTCHANSGREQASQISRSADCMTGNRQTANWPTHTEPFTTIWHCRSWRGPRDMCARMHGCMRTDTTLMHVTMRSFLGGWVDQEQFNQQGVCAGPGLQSMPGAYSDAYSDSDSSTPLLLPPFFPTTLVVPVANDIAYSITVVYSYSSQDAHGTDRLVLIWYAFHW